MIPDHEDLGNLVTTDIEWYRPLHGYWEEEELQEFMEGNNVLFNVVDRDYNGCCIWGFSKSRPIDSLIEENGMYLHIEKMWHGKYLGTRFSNDKLIEFEWRLRELEDEYDTIKIVVSNEGRCNGIIDMEGNRCEKNQYDYDLGFCATCKKYDAKVKAGKLKECKYCTSTYHSSRSCEQNPKVIEKRTKQNERFNLYLRERGIENEY